MVEPNVCDGIDCLSLIMRVKLSLGGSLEYGLSADYQKVLVFFDLTY